MNLAPVVAQVAPLGYTVAGLAQLSAAASYPQTVMLWIVPLDERAEANLTVGGVYQKISSRLGVVFRIRDVSDPRGEASLRILEGVRDEVRGVLGGWSPGSEHAPLELRAGALLEIAEGAVWWQDIYETYINRRLA